MVQFLLDKTTEVLSGYDCTMTQHPEWAAAAKAQQTELSQFGAHAVAAEQRLSGKSHGNIFGLTVRRPTILGSIIHPEETIQLPEVSIHQCLGKLTP